MIGPKPALMRRGQIAGAFSDPDAIRTYEILQELIDQSPEAIQQAQDTADDAKSKVDALKATPQFLVLANTSLLASERAAVFSGGLAGVDAGAGSTYTVDFAAVADQRILANVSGGSAKPTPTAHNLILGIGSALKWTTARTLTLGTHLTGNVAFDGSADFTLNATLATTAVTPGSYTNANITVDAYGRITLAANGSGGGASAFTSLTDVPASYTGQSLKAVRVNAGETGLEFYTPSGGSGTVTSVGLSLPAFLTVSGSPVTGAGTLTAVLATQSANLVFAGPSTGAAAAPTFRSLVAADLPNTAVTPAAYTYASLTIDAQGRVTAASNGTAPPSAANPSATISGSAVNGSASTFMRSDAAPALANTAVTPGSYTNVNATVDAQGRITAMSNGSGGGVTAPTIRGTGIQASSAGGYTVTWPAGTVAGDLAIIFCGHGFQLFGNPPGWTVLDNLTGTNFNGFAIYRVLNTTDISTGSLAITLAGTYSGVVAIVTFQGATGGVRAFISTRFAASTTPITIRTDGSPLTTDMALYFGSLRGTGIPTISLGSSQQTASTTDAAAALYAGAPASTGGVSPVFTYTSFSANPGSYSIAIAVKGL